MTTITGTSTSDTIVAGSGDDVINSGNGDDTVDGGGGDDTLRGGAGSDTLVYTLSDNLSLTGTSDLYVGGSGIDTVRLVLTEEQFNSDNVQTQITAYLAHLDAVRLNQLGEVSNGTASDFTFNFEFDGQFSTLTVSMMEKLEIVVSHTNEAPVITGDLQATIAEGDTYVITGSDLGFSDTDDVAAGVTFTVSSQINGTVEVDGFAVTTFTATDLADGKVSFRHNGSEESSASFQVTVEDGNEDGSTPVPSTFHFTVTPVNDAPTTTPVVLTEIAEDSGARLITQEELLANASDVDSAALTVTGLIISMGSGTLQDNGDGTWNYTPADNDDTSVTFSYNVTDGVISTPATATLDITPENDAPTDANETAANTAKDDAVTVTGNVLINASDPDTQPSPDTLTVLEGSPGGTQHVLAHGTLTLYANGDYSYIATDDSMSAGFTGSETFNYTVSDGNGGTDTSTLTINLAGANDPPLAQDVAASGDEDTMITVQLAGTDVDGTATSFTLVTLPANGTLYTDEDGTVEAVTGLAYTSNTFYFAPDTDFFGDDSFTYTTGDDQGMSSAPATASIVVADVLDLVAQDGYIVGATVFADANDNKIWDLGEAITTTGANGQFSLPGGSGTIILSGGTDMATGLAFEGVLKAPEGSVIVSPLTTLIEALIPEGTGPEDLATAIEAAELQVTSALGLTLPEGETLTSYDPTQAALTGDLDALAIYSASVQIQNTIVLATAATGNSIADTAAEIFAELATLVAVENTTVELTDTATLTALVEAADTDGNTDTTNAVSVIAALNTAADEAGALTEVVQTAVVASSDGASSAADPDTTSEDNTAFVAVLDTTIAAADVGAIAGTQNEPTSGDDTITGLDAVANPDDALDGQGGNDLIHGGLGNDYLFGGAGNDQLFGDEGDDQLFGEAGNDILTGGAGDDVLNGGESPAGQRGDRDLVNYAGTGATIGVVVNLALHTASDGLGGNDILVNVEGAIGTEHADILTGGDISNFGTSSSEQFEGLAGNDTITGGIDNNFALYTSAPSGIIVNLDTVNHIVGAVTVDAGTALDGYGDIDTLVNINRIRGSAFADVIYGSAGIATAIMTGRERFEGMAGDDTIHGGGGTDLVMYSESDGPVTVTLGLTGAGTASDGYGTTDTFDGIEGVRGSKGHDLLTGSNRTDQTELFEGLAGNDTITGAGGADRVEFFQSPTGVIVNLSGSAITVGGTTVLSNTALDGFGTTDVLSGIEQAIGSQFNDTLVGNELNNYFQGREGDDTIDGREAAAGQLGDTDTVDYDILQVTSGVIANLGATSITADIGFGSVNVAGGTAYSVFGGTDTLINIEQITGSDHADYLLGSTSSDTETFEGRGGNDYINGGDGTNAITDPDRNDLVSYRNAAGGVVVDLSAGVATNDGDGGMDTLVSINQVRGSAFADDITGSNNPNTLAERFEGMGGNDTIHGAGGLDYVQYNNSPNAVTVNLAGAGGVTNTGSALDGFGGTDTFYDIEAVRGSNFSDTLRGYTPTSVDPLGTNPTVNQRFEGLGGNDLIDGGFGQDRAEYTRSTSGVVVDLSVGTASDGLGGTDTLVSIEDATTSIFNDLIIGSNGNNRIDGGVGNDTVSYQAAGSGVTVNLATTTTQNTINAGSDTLIGIENLIGSAFNDILTGDTNANVLDGGDGDDNINGSNGNDTILGGGGNDTLNGAADTDYIDGGSGIDTLNRSSGTSAQIVNFIAGTSGADTILNMENVIGSAFDDILIGNSGANLLDGGLGNDTLRGTDGDDTLLGGDGDDFLGGGSGADSMDGGAGIDTVGSFGSSTGGTINLGVALNGFDTIVNVENVNGSAFNDTLLGNSVANVLDGRAGNDSLSGLDGNDQLFGRDGDDTLMGGLGADIIDGGTTAGINPGSTGDIDRVDYQYAGSGIKVNLSGTYNSTYGINAYTGLVTLDALDVDTITNVEWVSGSDFDDIIIGGGNVNFERFEGRRGNDIMLGGAALLSEAYYLSASAGVIVNLGSTTYTSGAITVNAGHAREEYDSGATVYDDTLININAIRGSNFADVLIGSDGNNRFRSEGGSDTIDGGLGTDEADYRSSTSVQANLAMNIAIDSGGTDTLTSIENLRGSSGNDILTGDDVANRLRGESGNDTLIGGDGDDTLEGAAGNDFLDGGLGNDVLNGGENTSGLGDRDTVSYLYAASGVTVNLAEGWATTGAESDTLIDIEVVIGSNFADTLIGGDPNNSTITESEFFQGRGGNDTINGGAGNDWASYENAAAAVHVDLSLAVNQAIDDGDGGVDNLINIDRVRGSAFADLITGSNNAPGTNERFEGMAGADTIDGGGGFDYVHYQNGNAGGVIVNLDTVNHIVGIDNVLAGTARDGFDSDLGLTGIQSFTDTLSNIEGVRGSNFADTFFGSNNAPGTTEAFEGLGGNDTIIGGGGFDRIEYNRSTSGVNVNLAAGFASNDGLGGVDTFSGIEAARGSIFNDTLTGSANADTLDGREGNDFLVGGAGNDILNGGENLAGELGDGDTVSYLTEGGTNGVTVNLATGVATDSFGNTDTLIDVETVRGTNFADLLVGGNPTNSRSSTEQYEGRGGNDTLDGGVGFDWALYSNAASAVHVDLAAGFAYNDGDGGVDTLINIDRVRGSAFDDRLYGSDTTGTNTGYSTGTNVERFQGGDGNDYIDGRGGFDYVHFDDSNSAVTVDLQEGTGRSEGDVDVLVNIEGARGSAFSDFLYGSDNALFTEEFEGLAGYDFIDGRGGLDMVTFGRSTSGVTVNLATGTASDGFGTTDTLVNIESVRGSVYGDTLTGDAGANVLDGSMGNDILVGAGGADTFDWNLYDQGTSAAPAVDTIADFDVTMTGNTDALDLRDILTGEHANAASLDAYLDFSLVGSDTVIDVKSSGGAVDQQIVLQGVDLTAGGTNNDSQIITNLLSANKLLVDL